MLRLLLVSIFTILIASCAAQQEAQLTHQPEVQSSTPEFTHCPEQRVNMCTRQYLPVCATRDTGVRCVTTPCPSSEQKTYSNGCEACADVKVLGYVANACTQEPTKK